MRKPAFLSKSITSSLQPSSVAVQPGFCRTRSETPKTYFSQCGSNYPSVVTKYQLLLEPRCEKTGLPVSDQVQHKPGCTATEDG